MSEYLTFTGRVEPLVWGKSTYTILRLPPDVTAALHPARRVEGEVNDHPVNLALTRAPVVEGVFLWAGKGLLDRVGITPGEPVEVRLRPAPDDRMDTPDDIAAALRAGGAGATWDALTPGKRRGLIYQIGTAKTDATRSKRILALIRTLTE